MSTQDYFRDKGVIVTGGSSGIGLAFARKIADYGAEVTLVARRRAILDEAERDVTSRTPGAKVHTLELDVSREDDVTRAIERHAASHRIDMLVNNAGVVMPGRFTELPTKEFRQMMDVNYFGTVYMTKAVLPHLVARHGGHVLNVSSLAGVMGIYGYTAYAASKFAIVGLSQALRAEMWPHGVRVSVCLPPDTDTPQLAFENQHKPAETKAIAGTVKTLTADAVAQSMADGMAKNTFEIYPDLASRMVALGQGVLPGVARWVCDSAQKKAGAVS
ncbi:MAG: SDR family oxidoreductase [Polyangiaceae bacterium]|nr:SDR family oxidoreductase [Polyangiaceae bacterium]